MAVAQHACRAAAPSRNQLQQHARQVLHFPTVTNSVRVQAEVEFVRELCEGGNGRVVLAQHACLAGQVAIKVVSSRVVDDVRVAVERLLDLEATVTTVVGDHANIVQVCSCTAARRPCCAHSDHCAELSLHAFIWSGSTPSKAAVHLHPASVCSPASSHRTSCGAF